MVDFPDPEMLLTRREAAAALTSGGYKCSPALLSKLARTGGGPPFQYWGTRVVYRAGPLLTWATGRLRPHFEQGSFLEDILRAAIPSLDETVVTADDEDGEAALTAPAANAGQGGA